MGKTTFSLLALLAILACQPALAANADCDKAAADKKLAGAAKASFVKKCEKDAAGPAASAAMGPSAACEKSASDKRLAGAAKTSHLKKCMADEKK